MKRIMLIVNPCAGTKRANRYLCDIVDLFYKHGYETVVFTTQGKGDGTKIVVENINRIKPDIVVCIGGDGTYNEVASGVVFSSVDVPIGYIPAGTTNDLGTTFGIPKTIMQAAKNVVEGQYKKVDIGDFNGRYFSYIASFGAFTEVSYTTDQGMKNVLGHFAYILSGVKSLSSIKPIKIECTADGENCDGVYIFGSISNTRHIAGLVELKSEIVDLTDGKFEVMLVKYPSDAMELASIIYSINTGKYDSKLIKFISAKNVHIKMPGNVNWTIDGEYQSGCEEIVAKNLYQKITLILPEK